MRSDSSDLSVLDPIGVLREKRVRPRPILTATSERFRRITSREARSEQGYEVLSAGDAATARALLDQAAPNAVLLDVGLPGEDGLSLARAIRERFDLGIIIIPERLREAHAAGMHRYLETGERHYLGRRVEMTAMRSDGSEFPVELAIEVAEGPEGRIFIGYLRDITERWRSVEDRIRLESQLRQAQKMEAIGQLTGGIAHDFNNMLTSIMGYLTMARERTEHYGDARLAKYLDRAERSGQRARDLIAQMLTFSRGQRGEPRALQLGPHLAEAMRLLTSILPSSVEIRSEFARKIPCVQLDPLHVEQVLMNLCINARDAMEGKGTLTLALQPVHGGPACAPPATSRSKAPLSNWRSATPAPALPPRSSTASSSLFFHQRGRQGQRHGSGRGAWHRA